MTLSAPIQSNPRAASIVSLAADSLDLAEKYDGLSNLQLGNGKRLAAELDIKPGQSVLDVGAGTGRLAEHVVRLVGDPSLVSGVDPLPLRIGLARRRLGPQAKLVVGRAEDLSAFEEDSYDHVYFNAVYHWLPDQPAALREAARVLRRGGRVGITTGDREHENSFERVTKEVLARPAFSGLGYQEWLPYRVSVSILREQLEAAGFVPRLLEVRAYVDYYTSAEEVLDFNASSSFGNFLGELPRARVAAVRKALAFELERLRTPKGIPLDRHTIFAVGDKH